MEKYHDVAKSFKVKEIEGKPYVEWFDSKSVEELKEIAKTKDRQAHTCAQKARDTGSRLYSSTADRLFKELHVVHAFINEKEGKEV